MFHLQYYCVGSNTGHKCFISNIIVLEVTQVTSVSYPVLEVAQVTSVSYPVLEVTQVTSVSYPVTNVAKCMEGIISGLDDESKGCCSGTLPHSRTAWSGPIVEPDITMGLGIS